MAVSRIATADQYKSVLADLMRAQNRQVEAQSQVATGKRGNDLLGYADRARSLIAAQSVKTRVDGLVEQLNGLDVKLQAQQLSLESLSDSAQGLKDAIAGALASGRADGLMNQVQNFFSQSLEALNSRYGDGYLFSGGLVDTPPVNISSLGQLAAASPVDNIFDNGTLVPVSRMDDSSTLQTGFLADAIGKPMMQAIQRIQLFHQGGTGNFGGALTDAQRIFLETELGNMDGVAQGTVSVTAQGGGVQKRVEHTLLSQTQRQTTMENILGDITDVDIGAAASALTQAQVAVQASAQVLLSLKDMSLLNFLSRS